MRDSNSRPARPAALASLGERPEREPSRIRVVRSGAWAVMCRAPCRRALSSCGALQSFARGCNSRRISFALATPAVRATPGANAARVPECGELRTFAQDPSPITAWSKTSASGLRMTKGVACLYAAPALAVATCRYLPVIERGFAAMSSGVPTATISPPPSPPSGPRSMM